MKLRMSPTDWFFKKIMNDLILNSANLWRKCNLFSNYTTDPKIFLRAPWAPILTIFWGGARAKKTRFFCQNFSKSAPKTAFLYTVFQKFACYAENFAKIVAKQCFGRARKINLVDLKKKLSKFFENPPPLEKILDPPLILPLNTWCF